MRLESKVAVVTGAARGIGYAVVQAFLSEGAKVALWDVSEPMLSQARSRLNAPEDRVMFQVVDVTRSAQVAEAMERVESTLGPVDIQINNAGVTRDAMLHKMTDEDWDRVIDVNLKGVFVCGREAGRRMRERGSGVILNTASIVGLYGNVGQTNYAATKAGVIAMTQSWAKELGKKGVRVNAVAPGYTATEMMQTVPEKVLDTMKSKTPLGRLAEPAEIAAAFVFLASNQASFITGHVLSVDGGLVI